MVNTVLHWLLIISAVAIGATIALFVTAHNGWIVGTLSAYGWGAASGIWCLALDKRRTRLRMRPPRVPRREVH